MDLIHLKRPHPHITLSTPLCVILKLAKVHSIRYDEERETDPEYIEYMIPYLERTSIQVPRKHNEWLPNDKSRIARFANPDVKNWVGNSLVDAFNHSITHHKLPINYENAKFGPKTNYHPNTYDEIQTWTFVVEMGFNTSRETLFYEMVEMIRMSHLPSTYRHLIGLNGIDEKSMAMAIISRNLSLVEFTGSKSAQLLPTSDKDAIRMAVSKGYDFSLAKSPILEYCILIEQGEKYTPVDDILVKAWNSNPYRIKFGHYFNPEIPVNLYTEDNLKYFRQFEGLDRHFFPNLLYNKLCEISIQSNFHHLPQPEVEKDTTNFTLENIIPGDLDIVCYGVISYDRSHFLTNNTMRAYKLEELVSMFRSNDNFIDPLAGEEFSFHSIKKLEKVCLGILGSSAGNETKGYAQQLIQQINRVNIIQKGINKKTERWLKDVRNSVCFPDVIKVLKILLGCGMYMRGWEGEGFQYPLDERLPINQDEIDQRVGVALIKFQTYNDMIPSNLQVDSLPLYLYEKGNYVTFKSNKDGKTIGERVSLIAEGNTTDEIRSCIRVSSNWIVSSSYYYLQLLHHPPSFSIERLYPIS